MPQMQLLSIRSSDIAFAMGAKARFGKGQSILTVRFHCSEKERQEK